VRWGGQGGLLKKLDIPLRYTKKGKEKEVQRAKSKSAKG
jgi:hypothetical protein